MEESFFAIDPNFLNANFCFLPGVNIDPKTLTVIGSSNNDLTDNLLLRLIRDFRSNNKNRIIYFGNEQIERTNQDFDIELEKIKSSRPKEKILSIVIFEKLYTKSIETYLTKARTDTKIGLVIIDCIQDVITNQTYVSDYARIDYTMRCLRDMSKRHCIPLIATTKSTNNRPTNPSIDYLQNYESVLQHSDAAISISKSSDTNLSTISIIKNSFGPTCTIESLA